MLLYVQSRGCSHYSVANNGRMGVPAARVSYLSNYFDSLVDLIPVKHYIDPDEVLDLKNMKREERQQTKRAFKTQHKLSKRAKLDPDGDAHTTAAQRRQEAEEQRLRPNVLLLNHEGPGGAPGPGTLRERLAAKVQSLRDRRKADARKEGVEKAKAWKQEQHITAIQLASGKQRDAQHAVAKKADMKGTDTGSDVMFNKLQFKDDSQRPKTSKKQSKHDLLKQAEAKAAEANAEVPVDAWPKMMKLAKGEKVLDDPKLLKRSVKRMQKDKQKSKEGWKTRTDAVRKKQASRQEKRQSNLQKKVDQKKAKKQQKREKRFLGAGFEGRTSGLRS